MLAFVKALREAFGAIFGLVNNDAGIGHEVLPATIKRLRHRGARSSQLLSPVVLTK
jgi:hypothetical protein